MKYFLTIISLVFLLDSIEVQAQEALSYRDRKLSTLRTKIEKSQKRARILQRKQLSLSKKLTDLANEIQVKKSQYSADSLIPDLGLQALLQQAQVYSEQLTSINRELELSKKARNADRFELGRYYQQLVDQTVKQIQQAKSKKPKELLLLLSRLQRERKGLTEQRLTLSPANSHKLDQKKLLDSEDPEELEERADAVSDQQDKLRRQLVAVDKRLASLKSKTRLSRELRDFMNDQFLFGEESRTLKLSRSSTTLSETNKEDPVPSEYTDDLPDTAFILGNGTDTDGPPEGGGWRTDEDGYEPSPGGTNPGGGISDVKQGRVPVGVEGSDADLSGMTARRQTKILKQRRFETIQQITKLQLLHDLILEKAELMGQD